MATLQSKPTNSAGATRDAMFLFELFRQSPTPIVIQIGPYAAKMGVKPNTIIKRLAGIKARNGLKISTTLGKYDPPAVSDGGVKVEMKSDVVKTEHLENNSFDANVDFNIKREEVSAGPKDEIAFTPCLDTGLRTPETSPLKPKSSPHNFYQQQQFPSFEQFGSVPFPFKSGANHPKRAFEQVVDLDCENLDGDEKLWKKVRMD